MNNPIENYISTTEAAQILGIDPKSAGFLARQGKIPAVKIANRWLVDRTKLNEFKETYEGRKGRPTGYSPKKEVEQ
ncbi:MAG: helix-turn-helix domain-containing protein [Planctomycetes bacterium]|nr:helix-turn-helix domain-containing protein [Planctomycetota bacterium]